MHWRGGVVIEREGMRERKEKGGKIKADAPSINCSNFGASVVVLDRPPHVKLVLKCKTRHINAVHSAHTARNPSSKATKE
ncbi:hypothetical protein EVAR_47258_1 [Eumeta japonica]|uniref:Uncharacterized protein n=1 Tax=Eumeta variegata TaxID=151549 RepID=A0A4C1XGR5_EUMVA|nr:hypothetical protein EVAR_47258_1 [Eumeta japonica]